MFQLKAKKQKVLFWKWKNLIWHPLHPCILFRREKWTRTYKNIRKVFIPRRWQHPTKLLHGMDTEWMADHMFPWIWGPRHSMGNIWASAPMKTDAMDRGPQPPWSLHTWQMHQEIDQLTAFDKRLIWLPDSQVILRSESKNLVSQQLMNKPLGGVNGSSHQSCSMCNPLFTSSLYSPEKNHWFRTNTSEWEQVSSVWIYICSLPNLPRLSQLRQSGVLRISFRRTSLLSSWAPESFG